VNNQQIGAGHILIHSNSLSYVYLLQIAIVLFVCQLILFFYQLQCVQYMYHRLIFVLLYESGVDLQWNDMAFPLALSCFCLYFHSDYYMHGDDCCIRVFQSNNVFDNFMQPQNIVQLTAIRTMSYKGGESDHR